MAAAISVIWDGEGPILAQGDVFFTPTLVLCAEADKIQQFLRLNSNKTNLVCWVFCLLSHAFDTYC